MLVKFTKKCLIKSRTRTSKLLKKSIYAGCSKMLRCKTCAVCDTCLQAIMRNEAYFLYAAMKHDKRRRSRWAFFNSLLDAQKVNVIGTAHEPCDT